MPVFWFGLSQITDIHVGRAVLVFVVLHILVYPASNGYNSYMDKDVHAIGGVEHPKLPTKELFYTTIIMDILALLLSLIISTWFLVGLLAFIAASRAYSYRGIRLKKYPIIGYLTVIIFQGGLIYFMVKHGCSQTLQFTQSWSALLGASLLIGAFYPLTQIYQHEQDKADGVTSISAALGYKGTFLFTIVIFSLAMACLGWYFANNLELEHFLIIQICMLPTLVYFLWWMLKVFKNESAANFSNTMKMSIIGSFCSNAAFISILMINHFE
jgi:1,4-dihydroxy-2-naphthoate octaprenyltransferase